MNSRDIIFIEDLHTGSQQMCMPTRYYKCSFSTIIKKEIIEIEEPWFFGLPTLPTILSKTELAKSCSI